MKKNAVVYLRWLLIPLSILIPVLALLALYFGKIEGDLVRIGRWAERDFSWHRKQPAYIRAGNGTTVEKPEVLVLGDSFTRPQIWQAYTGLSTQSYDYSSATCIEQWLSWAANRPYASARVIIVQSIERSLIVRFSKLESCTAKHTPFALESQAASFPTKTRSAIPTWPITLDANYLLNASVNAVRLRTSDQYLASDNTRVVRLTNAQLFSNSRPDSLLYFADDERKSAWTKQDVTAVVDNLHRVQIRLAQVGLKFLFVPVPDKFTVYRPYLAQPAAPMPDLFAALAEGGIEFVDLQKVFRQALPATVDLYLPNDTHLGVAGYQLMGREIAKKLLAMDSEK